MSDYTLNRLKKVYDIHKNDGKIREIVFRASRSISDYTENMVYITDNQ